MSTTIEPQQKQRGKSRKLIEMNWDPITRIVGSLGIFTKIDFDAKEVAECYSTSSIFRGYSIFMKGKDPRDAHFITSRICGICGDNHATCACYCAEHGLRRPPAGSGRVDRQPRRGGRVHVRSQYFPGQPGRRRFLRADGARNESQRVGKARKTECPHAKDHGYKRISDIMTALNPFTGEFYRETLAVSRYTREMFCLMEGRHVHPSTLYPGGVGTVPTIQLFTDYLTRLMKYCEFMKKVVPLHDDLFDFFYQALPGYEKVGQRRILLGCWGSFQNPKVCDYQYRNMTEWGRAMYVTPGVVVDGKLVTTDLVEIGLGIRILLGSSFYEDWEQDEMFVKHDPLGNPVDRRHPWNQTTTPRPQKRDFADKYTWVMSPRWYDKRHGRSSRPRHRRRADRAPLVDRPRGAGRHRLHPGHRQLGEDPPAQDGPQARSRVRMENPQVEQRHRTRPRPHVFPGLRRRLALYFCEKAMAELYAGDTQTWTDFKVPDNAIGCGFHEAVRGVLSHHVVIRDGKIANYHPYPPTPWNASPRDSYGTPGPYEDAVQNTPLFEENGPDNFKGIDIMRAVRSFDPCLPCGVHMYLGGGKVLEQKHVPMFGAHA